MDSQEYWPLPGLRLRTGRLELRLPDAADLTALAALAELPLVVLGFLAAVQVDLEPGSGAGGGVVGTQGMIAADFAVTREVGTGSWLGLRYQGQGRKLGYADDGVERHVVRGKPHETRRLRLDRASWQGHRTIEVTISGLGPCLLFFGAA